MYALTNDARVNKVVLYNSQSAEKQCGPQSLPPGLQSAHDGCHDRDRQRTKKRYQLQDAGHDPENEGVVVPEQIETDGANRPDKDARDQLSARISFKRIVDIDHYRLDAGAPITDRNNA